MSGPRTPVPMCCVSIGYQHFLLPASQGMKLLSLLQSAVTCEQEYQYESGGHSYTVGKEAEVQYTAVRADQIQMPQGTVSPAQATTRARLPNTQKRLKGGQS